MGADPRVLIWRVARGEKMAAAVAVQLGGSVLIWRMAGGFQRPVVYMGRV
jgi:hypothetical protein